MPVSAALLGLAFHAAVWAAPPDATPLSPTASIVRTPASDNDVAGAYEALLSKSIRERAAEVEQMPPPRRAAIWTHHFLSYLATHPELTDEQRAVIQDAILLMTPQLFALDPSSPEWTETVDKPLQGIAQRARRVFSPALARELFVHLGPEPPSKSILERVNGGEQGSAQQGGSRSRRPVVTDAPSCECSIQSDWCSFEWGMPMKCVQGGCYFTTSGCGTLFRYACNGMCLYDSSGG